MDDSLLRNIYLIGQEMASALQQGNLEHYFELLDERGTLLEEILGYQHPSEIDPNWKDVASALQEQYEVLTTALAEQERKMQEELGGMQRYKGASRSYQQSEARPQILNDNLRV